MECSFKKFLSNLIFVKNRKIIKKKQKKTKIQQLRKIKEKNKNNKKQKIKKQIIKTILQKI
jgi:hypothetical protein